MTEKTYPKYYLNDDNFPFREIICDSNNPEHLRSNMSDDGFDLVVFRYWKGKERHSYNFRNTVKITKEEFDLWVEYWKIYWEIERAKESEDKKLESKKEIELEKIDTAICEYRRKNT